MSGGVPRLEAASTEGPGQNRELATSLAVDGQDGHIGPIVRRRRPNMKWQHVQENWVAFYDAIQSRWPDADPDELDDIDGDQKAFIVYVARL